MEVDDNLAFQDEPMQGFPAEARPGHRLLDLYRDHVDFWNTPPGTSTGSYHFYDSSRAV
ncbi:hypothetical protein CVT24_010931, partial [Panaeolus cyanescens]